MTRSYEASDVPSEGELVGHRHTSEQLSAADEPTVDEARHRQQQADSQPEPLLLHGEDLVATGFDAEEQVRLRLKI
jgi:hypothetical protein